MKKENLEQEWLSAFKSKNLPPLEIGFDNKHRIVFHLRKISDTEEDSVNKEIRELIDLPEETQVQKLFEIYREALARFSVESPDLVVGEKTKKLEGTPSEALNKIFAEFDDNFYKALRRGWFELKLACEINANFK